MTRAPPSDQRQRAAQSTCSSSLSASIHLALKISKNWSADTMPEDSRSILESKDLWHTLRRRIALAPPSNVLYLRRRRLIAQRTQGDDNVLACSTVRRGREVRSKDGGGGWQPGMRPALSASRIANASRVCHWNR